MDREVEEGGFGAGEVKEVFAVDKDWLTGVFFEFVLECFAGRFRGRGCFPVLWWANEDLSAVSSDIFYSLGDVVDSVC